jgi:hypothetical protein
MSECVSEGVSECVSEGVSGEEEEEEGVSECVSKCVSGNMTLKSLISKKDELIKQIKTVDTSLHDYIAMLSEEELRADQFYMLLDEQSNTTQFVSSVMKKMSSLIENSHLMRSLDMMTQEALTCTRTHTRTRTCTCAHIHACTCTIVPDDTSKDISSNGIHYSDGLNGNKSTLVEKQNKVIDEYLAVVSSTCMNTLSLPKLEGHVTHSLTQCGDIKEEEMSDEQLQERLDTLHMERELLMECIKTEEVKLLL